MLESDDKVRIAHLQKILTQYVEGMWRPFHDETGHYYKKKRCRKKVPSVTTQNVVAKPHLLHWATRKTAEAFRDNPALYQNYIDREKELESLGRPAGMTNKYLYVAQQAHTDIRDDAASVGTLGHNLIERYINLWMKTGVRPDDIRKLAKIEEADEPRAIAVARNVEAIFDEYNVYPLGAELLVGSNEYKMAGTLDFLCYNLDTKEVEVWDWKSSNQVDDDYARQVASYKYLLLEMCRNKFKIPVCRVMRLDKWSNRFKPYIVNSDKEAFEAQLANNLIYRWKTSKKLKLTSDKKRLIL